MATMAPEQSAAQSDPWAVVSVTPASAGAGVPARTASKKKAAVARPASESGSDGWDVVSVVPSPSATPVAPSLSAASPVAGLTANPHHEGVYPLQSPSGQTIAVPYSKVATARKQGYRFANQSALETYARDFVNDPQHPQAVDHWLQSHPLVPGTLGLRAIEGVEQSGTQTMAGIDRIVSRLSGEHPIESLQLTAAEDAARKSGVPELTGKLAEQIGEIALPEAALTDLAKGTGVADAAARVPELTHFLDAFPKVKKLVALGLKAGTEATKAAAEQGTQAYARSGGDRDQATAAAEGGAIFGGAATAIPLLAEPFGNFLSDAMRHRMGVDEFETEDLVRATEAANKKIDAKADRLAAVKETAAAKARDAGDEAKAAAAEAEAARIRQQAVNAKRDIHQQTEYQLRNRLAERIKNLRDAAVKYFRKNYDDIEKEIGDERRVDWSDITHLVENEALPKIAGSDKTVKPFSDILKKAEKFSADEDQPPPKLAGEKHAITQSKWQTMDPEEQHEAWERAREEWGPSQHGVSFRDLKQYYSEAGQLLGEDSTPADVKQALIAFREGVDKFQQQLADETGPKIGARYRLLRNQYKQYAQDFLPQGPTSSPLAKGLRFTPSAHEGSAVTPTFDAHEATRPYLSLAPEQVSNLKKAIAGSESKPETQFIQGEFPSSRGKTKPAFQYRLDTAKLLDRYRMNHAALEELPSAEKLEQSAQTAAKKAESAQAAAVKATRTTRQAEAEAKQTLTPAQLQQAKAIALHKTAHNLGKFGLWVSIGGIVAGTSTFLRTGDLKKAMLEAGGGMAAGLITPYLASRMFDQPGVSAALTRVSRRDLEQLMKLPPDQRGDVEQAIRQMADEAVRQGKLKASQIPWYRILGGEAGRKITEPSPSALADQRANADALRELEELNRQLNPDETPQSQSQPSLQPQGTAQ